MAIITSKKLSCKKFKYTKRITSFEFIIVQFQGLHKTCLVVTVYRPPSSSIALFLEEFSSLVEELNTPNSDLILIGDFNLHIEDLSDTRATRFRDLLTDLSLQNHVQVPTYRRSSHTLDLVIDSYTDPIVSSVETSSLSSFSDHSLITFDVSCEPYYVKVDTQIQFRSYREIDSFQSQVRSILDVVSPGDSEFLANRLNHVLVHQRDRFFPLL